MVPAAVLEQRDLGRAVNGVQDRDILGMIAGYRQISSMATDGAQRQEADEKRNRPEGRFRNLLILASRFPPVASVGAIRVRKFVKYLRRYGWRPVVLTGAMRQDPVERHDVRRSQDLESLEDIPEGVPVYRLSPVMDNWPGRIACSVGPQIGKLTSALGWGGEYWSSWLKWRLQKFHDGLSFPDRGIWRLPNTLSLALRLHKRYRFDALFTSGMPFSDHIIGLALKMLIRRPWLVDFRDPWVEYIHWQQWHTELGHQLTQWAEAAVVHRASSVISVNEHMTQRFVSRYQDIPPGRFVTIPNGFDAADFPRPPAQEEHAAFRLLYAGSLYQTRTPRPMLVAFQRFIDRVPGSRERARFDFAGRTGPYLAEMQNLAADWPIHLLGMIPHSAALKAMSEADVNVVLLPNVPGGENDTTTKVYECLGSGRPILAVVPTDGAAAMVLRRFDSVWMCDPDDVEGITRAITDIYTRWLDGTLHVGRPARRLWEFTREYQTQQLAACLDQALSRQRRPGPGNA